MATRMQQRRGTQAQWTAANPVLAAGEIGFEIDNNRFKVGDGTNTWSAISYFVDIESVLGGVSGTDLPAALDTLNEIAAALNDDASLYNTLSNLINTGLQNNTTNLETHQGDATNVHGVADMTQLTTTNYVANVIDVHNQDTSEVHGIPNTLALATITDIANHSADTSDVHGIANTNAIVYTTDSRLSDERNPISDSVTTAKLANAAVTGPKIADNAISQSHLSDDSVGTNEIGGLAVTTAKLANAAVTTEKIAEGAVTKTMVGLANVDNTSDANKPISTATQTALDAKASLSGATFTGSVEIDQNLTVDGNFIVNGSNVLVSATQIQIEDTILQLGHDNANNIADLGLVVGYNDGSAKHAGIVKDITDGKWKLFKDLTVEPATTVDFGSASLDTLSVGALESANAITATGGVVFSDGTQTKEGVPSRTPIISKTASYTLSAASERDSLIEVDSTSGTTITIPLNSAVAFPVGTTLDILQTNTGQVTIAGDSGVTVNATPGLKLRTRWSSVTLFKRSTDSWVAFGDLTA